MNLVGVEDGNVIVDEDMNVVFVNDVMKVVVVFDKDMVVLLLKI